MIKTCVICGKEFDARNSAITCSPKCSEIRHNSYKRNPAEESYLRHMHSLMRRKMWLTIPDAPNYEIDSKLNVRNKKTGHILKPTIRNGTKYYRLPTVVGQHGCIYVFDNNMKLTVYAVADLLWEVHGIIRKRRSRFIPCYAENKHGKHSFPSLKACARFLAPKLSAERRR